METLQLKPREKFQRYGIEGLSDVELLQLILGSGPRGLGVKNLAELCLEAWDSAAVPDAKLWNRIGHIDGMGLAKTAQIAAAWELARRRIDPRTRKITCPAALYAQLIRYAGRPQETFITASVNGAQELLKLRIITVGLLNKTLIHPREVFAPAISDRAAGLLVAHNHPSGQLEPSREDLEVTTRLAQAGGLLGIPLLDHLIFTRDSYISLKELGHIL
jgi:DNA repair protein RadC